MTPPDLKPCPFCGAGAARSVGNASFSGVELMGAGTDRPYVWCGTCGSSGSFEDTDAKAVAAWNTRAPLAEALAVPEVAAMRSALMWAYDRLVTDGLTEKEIQTTADELMKVLRGEHSRAASHNPTEAWQSPALRAIGERADG